MGVDSGIGELPNPADDVTPQIKQAENGVQLADVNAVGVANVRDFADRIGTMPAYVTESDAGAGFAELATFLLRGSDT